MSSSGATLPIERSYLLRAWLVVAAIVVIAAATIALALPSVSEPPGGTTPGEDPAAVSQVGRGPHEPIVVNGNVCGQCR